MNFDLGSELNLLSLHDPVSADTTNDDPMEIDSVDSYQQEPEAGIEYQPLVVEIPDENDDTNQLLLNVLSPTNLGAQYALKQKLLMPPPPPDSTPPADLDHDYEFDTSAVQVHRSSAFQSVPERSTFDPAENFTLFRNDAAGAPSTNNEFAAPSTYSNLMNRSFQYRRQMFPEQYSQHRIQALEPDVRSIEVHHHHYYNNTPRNEPTNNHNAAYKPKNIHTADQNSQRKVSATPNSLASATITRHLQKHQDILPLPWNSESVPAERVPYVLSSYLQFALNLVLSCYAVHLIVSVVQTIRQDVAYRLESQANNLLVEMALCERSYEENHCSPDLIVPALEKMCAYWEKCMNQDPFRGGNTSLVSAQIIGMVVNLLIEPLSIKVLLVSAGAITIIFLCNFAFGYVRAKTYYGWPSDQRLGKAEPLKSG